MTLNTHINYGLVLLDKPKDKSSFYLVSFLRKLTDVRCIGHAGTLDPFATGLMVMLVGRPYTKLSNRFLLSDKEYSTRVHLGVVTDTYDTEGQEISRSDKIPTLLEIQEALKSFQGTFQQTPPMFSAKKIAGKRLYELARKGIEVKREPKEVTVEVTITAYTYPYLDLYIKCSSGTYIRSLGHDLGQMLGCGAHLNSLIRTQVGPFHLKDAQSCSDLTDLSQLKMMRQW